MNIICPYCGGKAELTPGWMIYPLRPDLASNRYWRCGPCHAWVGCHAPNPKRGLTGVEPLGRLANAELREAKQCAHSWLDPWWKEYRMWVRHPAFTHDAKYDKARRRIIYSWLSRELGIPESDCHIGMFDVETCDRVSRICEELENETVVPERNR